MKTFLDIIFLNLNLFSEQKIRILDITNTEIKAAEIESATNHLNVWFPGSRLCLIYRTTKFNPRKCFKTCTISRSEFKRKIKMVPKYKTFLTLLHITNICVAVLQSYSKNDEPRIVLQES